MIVLIPVAAARFRMSTNSARCCSAVSVARVGQSMFATVATHTPRISRWISGADGSVGGGGVTMPGLESEQAEARAARKSRLLVAAERRAISNGGKRKRETALHGYSRMRRLERSHKVCSELYRKPLHSAISNPFPLTGEN